MSANNKEKINATGAEAKSSALAAEATGKHVVNTEVPLSVAATGQQMSAKVELYLDDQEIQALRARCPVPDDNLARLEADIIERGCIDPIKFWKSPDGKNIVIDGYNRIAIFGSLGIDYSTTELRFDSREEAINYFIDSQIARRNLTDMQKAYLRGRRYDDVVQPHGGDRKSMAYKIKSTGQGGHLKTNAERAEEQEESDRTLRRYRDFAKGIDLLGQAKGPELTKKVLSEETKFTMGEIQKMAKKTPEEIKAELDKKPEPKTLDEQFAEFDKNMQSEWKKLKVIDKITITEDNKTKLANALKTASDLVEMIKKIQTNSGI